MYGHIASVSEEVIPFAILLMPIDLQTNLVEDEEVNLMSIYQPSVFERYMKIFEDFIDYSFRLCR
jgi:hypothetical protein